MQDRRQRTRTIGSSQIPSDAQLYHATQATNLTTALMLAVCGVKVLREPVKAELALPAAGPANE